MDIVLLLTRFNLIVADIVGEVTLPDAGQSADEWYERQAEYKAKLREIAAPLLESLDARDRLAVLEPSKFPGGFRAGVTPGRTSVRVGLAVRSAEREARAVLVALDNPDNRGRPATRWRSPADLDCYTALSRHARTFAKLRDELQKFEIDFPLRDEFHLTGGAEFQAVRAWLDRSAREPIAMPGAVPRPAGESGPAKRGTRKPAPLKPDEQRIVDLWFGKTCGTYAEAAERLGLGPGGAKKIKQLVDRVTANTRRARRPTDG